MPRWSIAFAKMVLLLGVLFFSKGALAAPAGQVYGVDPLGVVAGWADDALVPDLTIDVHFYVDHPAQAPAYLGFAGQMKTNLRTAQGPSGFSFGLPSQYFDGAQHLLYVYGVSANGAQLLAPAIPFTLTAGPIGKIESVDPTSGRVRGWARNPHPGSAFISVDVYVDTPPTPSNYSGYVFRKDANLPRAELNVLYRDDPDGHGFSFVLPPKYFDNAVHSLFIYGLSATSAPALTGSAMTFRLPAHPIIGGITSVATQLGTNNLKIQGWACQVGVATSIPVSVYAGASAYFSDGSPLAGTLVPSTYTVSASTSATNTLCGLGSNHNFQITVTAALRHKYQGLPLFVHGERVTGTSMNAALDGSGTAYFPLDANLTSRLKPRLPSVFATPAMLQTALSVPPSSSLTNSAVWLYIIAQADGVLNASPPFVASPYYGSRVLPPEPGQPPAMSFKVAIERDFKALPYLALACQVFGGNYCSKGVELLSAWATAVMGSSDLDPACWVKMPSALRAGVQLYCPKGARPDEDSAVQAGLNIARYLSIIIESYQLLATHMTPVQRDDVANWVRELGYTIKKSTLAWQAAVGEEEGPNNHLQWHNYGMVLAGLVTSDNVVRDNDLVTYALTDPANSQTDGDVSYERNYYGSLTDSIREVGNQGNIVRTCYDSAPKLPLSTGEIWDRYRHFSEMRPNPQTPAPCIDGPLPIPPPIPHDPPLGHGFSYSLFALLPMTYTAHLASSNGLTNNLTPLMSFVDPRDPDVLASGAQAARPSLFNALDFYSHMVVDTLHDYSTEFTAYPPYQGESVCAAADFGSFIVGKAYVPADLQSRFKVGKTIQAQLQEAQHVCRDRRSASDPLYFDFDDVISEGMPQLYLLLVNHQY